MSENIINWTDEYGNEYNEPLSRLQRNYAEMCQHVRNSARKDLRELTLIESFNETYLAAIQGNADIIDAIAKAQKAVELAGKYDEAMKQAVEARLSAEFPE